jgi:hypothetical protein
MDGTLKIEHDQVGSSGDVGGKTRKTSVLPGLSELEFGAAAAHLIVMVFLSSQGARARLFQIF